MSPADIHDALMAAVIAEVEGRGCVFRNSENVEDVVSKATMWLSGASKTSLMLSGMPGNGKTTLVKAMRALVSLLVTEDSYGNKISLIMCSAKDIVSMARKGDEEYQHYQRLVNVPLLAIDDFGEEPVDVQHYGNALSPMVDLLSVRYDRMLPTILTTNLGSAMIRQRYGDRLADRFNEMLDVIIFTQPSYR